MEAREIQGMVVTTKTEEMYQDYLKKNGITESMMRLDQRTEMRRAFFAGLGYMLHNMKEVPVIIKNDHEIIQVFNGYDDQISNFWDEQRDFQEEYKKFVFGDDIVELERGELKKPDFPADRIEDHIN